MQINQMIMIGALVLSAKIWYDVNELLKYQIRMQTYLKVASSVVSAMTILHKEIQ